MGSYTMTIRTGFLLMASLALLLSFLVNAKESGEESMPLKGDKDAVNVSVWFATNRQREAAGSAADTYTGERGKPHFGRCTVEFTQIPVMNHIAPEVSFHVPTEKRKLQSAEPLDEARFWESLTKAVAKVESGSLVLFVHGYNYDFEKTCGMAVEMQRVLSGKAVVLMFSWPSNGAATDYVSDQADVEWSVPFLADLIARLGDNLGRENVQVLAHSLGSRGVTFALQRLRSKGGRQPSISRLVLLAPDFDSQTFVDMLPEISPMAGGITLYASENDTPLKASRKLSGYPRLGEAGEYLTIVQGMETIDVSPAGLYQILGHEYFYFNPRVTADLVALLVGGKPPGERPGLRRRARGDISYWEIK
jgi:esterase/lipase superfamily enzyme